MEIFVSSFHSDLLFYFRNWGEEKREKECDFGLFAFRRRGEDGKMVPELFLFSSIMKIGRREKEKIRVHSHLFSCYFPFRERGNWGRKGEEKEAFCSSYPRGWGEKKKEEIRFRFLLEIRNQKERKKWRCSRLLLAVLFFIWEN